MKATKKNNLQIYKTGNYKLLALKYMDISLTDKNYTWAASSDLKCLQKNKKKKMKSWFFTKRKKNLQKGPFIDFSPHQSNWLFACDPKLVPLCSIHKRNGFSYKTCHYMNKPTPGHQKKSQQYHSNLIIKPEKRLYI